MYARERAQGPRVRPSCPSICFSKHRAQWIHVISWMITHHILMTYDGTTVRLYSTYVRWKRIMHYPTHEELMFVTLCLL